MILSTQCIYCLCVGPSALKYLPTIRTTMLYSSAPIGNTYPGIRRYSRKYPVSTVAPDGPGALPVPTYREIELISARACCWEPACILNCGHLLHRTASVGDATHRPMQGNGVPKGPG